MVSFQYPGWWNLPRKWDSGICKTDTIYKENPFFYVHDFRNPNTPKLLLEATQRMTTPLDTWHHDDMSNIALKKHIAQYKSACPLCHKHI